jgi:cation-transporting ATPase E
VTLDQSAAAGLDRAAVRARVAAGQVNSAPPGPGRTVGQIRRANVLTRFNAILGTLFVVVVVVGPPQELRDDTAATVRYLLGQGVAIKVLSGDAQRAVAAIAERAGIPVTGPPCDASALSDDQVAAALASTSVLGRVRPGHKLAVARALQASGHIVAMVGDGVNDVQALKQADLGIAMGSGSQASRSVARVVLLDGTFSAVPKMLHEGRRVIANI